ncbi:MAG: spore maturation protein [Elusimicrobia bacterium]|nr:spore maturation protein [Elusimicrobiota bacterium]
MNAFNYISQLVIPVFLLFAVIYGFAKKVKVYDSFIVGAKDGLGVVLKIFPYLLAIFVAIKGFQASGAFDFLKLILAPVRVFTFFNIPIEVISISIIKPLSGGASTAIFTDIVKTTGPDSPATRISAVIMGSAETTFYVIAVYLGAVGIKKTKYLVPVCVISDIIGIILAIVIVKWMF